MRYRTLLRRFFLLFVICWPAAGDPLPSKPFFAESFLFGVHRGGAKWRPESTVKTFQEAAQTWPGVLLETDARVTADGVVVLLHDPTVDRTTNGTGKIAELTWEQVKELDAGFRFSRDNGETFPFRAQGYQVPKLTDALSALPGSRFLIEFKDQPGIAKAAVRAIQEAGAEDRVLIASFNPEIMQQAEALEPRLATCFDSVTREAMVAALRGEAWSDYEPADDVFILDYSRLDRYGVTPADFPQILEKGIPIIAYTLDEPNLILQAIEQGISGILTDRPDIMSTVIEPKR